MRNVSRAVVCLRAYARPVVLVFPFVSLALGVASEASAQITDSVGVRAQGMGGAFTGVADDATATVWNPAGLAGGAFVNGVLEYGRPDQDLPVSVRGVAVAYPALGLTYYRLPVSEIRRTTSTVDPSADRQDQGILSLYGVTIGQSVGEHLVLGSTLKLLRGADTSADLDAGVMFTAGVVRAGLTVRDIAEPTVGRGADAYTLPRHARAGVALTSSRQRGVIGGATLSFDADLASTATGPQGEERDIALGAEVWTSRRTLGLRGGLSRNTVGDQRTRLSGGISATVRARTYVDAFFTGGDGRRGWGLDLRVTF